MQIRDVIGAAIVKTLDCVEPACAAGHVGKVAKTWSAKTTLTPIIPGHGVSASMPPCSRDYPPGRHCWTPATSTTACCCPSWCTVWTNGHPMLGPPSEEFLRNAHTDIPAVVEAMRQYWTPTRYARAG